MADAKEMAAQKLKALKDAGACKALLDDTKKWLDVVAQKPATQVKK
jgi:hypothetical protein